LYRLLECQIDHVNVSAVSTLQSCPSNEANVFDSVFEKCVSSSIGGAISINDGTIKFRVIRNTFYFCQATSEGAIWSTSLSLLADSNCFAYCTVTSNNDHAAEFHPKEGGNETMSTFTLCPPTNSNHAFITSIYEKDIVFKSCNLSNNFPDTSVNPAFEIQGSQDLSFCTFESNTGNRMLSILKSFVSINHLNFVGNAGTSELFYYEIVTKIAKCVISENKYPNLFSGTSDGFGECYFCANQFSPPSGYLEECNPTHALKFLATWLCHGNGRSSRFSSLHDSSNILPSLFCLHLIGM